MIQVTAEIALDEDELEFDYVRASGPGGQNINKVATAVQLRFNLGGSSALPESVRQRLGRLAGRRLNADGILQIEARRFRTQEQNRQDALDRLVNLIRAAALPPRPRRPTRPSAASRQRRLEAKKRRSTVKRLRRSPETE